MNGLTGRLSGIAARKDALTARARSERAALRRELRGLEGTIGAADRGWQLIRFVRERPAIIVGVLGVLLAIRRRRLLPLAGGALSLWRLYRGLTAGFGRF